MSDRLMVLDEMAEAGERIYLHDCGGCTCSQHLDADGKHTYQVSVDSPCGYHRAAALQPWNHAIPWNCPDYWDGCNCGAGSGVTPT